MPSSALTVVEISHYGLFYASLIMFDPEVSVVEGSKLSSCGTFRYVFTPAEVYPDMIVGQIRKAILDGETSGQSGGYEWKLPTSPEP